MKQNETATEIKNVHKLSFPAYHESKNGQKIFKKIRTKWNGLEPQVHSNKKNHKGSCQAYNESKDGKKIKLQ